MTPSARAKAWSAVAVVAVGGCAAAAISTGCASGGFDNRGASAGSAGPATAAALPDDADVASLVPLGPRIVIDVNLAALRRSAWTAAALSPRDASERTNKAIALGYDDSTDVDRIVYAVTGLDGSRPTLAIAQGRFVKANVEGAFRNRWPGAVVEVWRQIPITVSGDNGLAFLTPRTFVSGAPADVHAVIDRAYGSGESLDADPGLGPLERALDGAGTGAVPVERPAILLLSTVDSQLRGRLAEVFSVPAAVTHVAVRLDLGRSLTLSALLLARDRTEATELARELAAAMRSTGTRLMVAAVGLSPILNNLEVTAEGARVRVTSVVDENDRAELGQALQGLLKLLRNR